MHKSTFFLHHIAGLYQIFHNCNISGVDQLQQWYIAEFIKENNSGGQKLVSERNRRYHESRIAYSNAFVAIYIVKFSAF